jgi:hypothetical protein
VRGNGRTVRQLATQVGGPATASIAGLGA